MKQKEESNRKRSIALKKYWANKKDRTSPNKGKTYIELYGEEKAKNIKQKQSMKKKGNNNPTSRQAVKDKISNTAKNNYAKGLRKLPKNNTAKGSYREDLQQYVRSTWEANFIRILKFHNIKYEYELNIPIKINNQLITYFVDFYLPDYNVYIEIKGEIYSKEKYEAFCNQYNYKHILINKKIWNKLKELYSYLIINWEGRKKYPPDKIIPSETKCQTELFKILNISEDIVHKK